MEPFDYCGFASREDLQSEQYKKYFSEMEKFQDFFLQFENKFRSKNYPWPRDPLHTWSRCWEYPYVYHHIKKRMDNCNKSELKIVDFGSGVTFFPFFLKSKNYEIICIDNNVIVQNDLKDVSKYMSGKNFMVDFKLSEGYSIPIKNQEIDLLYSISVLEHIPDPVQIILEFFRVLKPNGFLILTFDVNINNKSKKYLKNYSKMLVTLKNYFSNAEEEKLTNINKILTSSTSLYNFSKSYNKKNKFERINCTLNKIFPGRARILGCQGVILKKKNLNEVI